MNNRIRRYFSSDSLTHNLLIGLLIGYALYITWLGLRRIVLVSGALIVVVTFMGWLVVRLRSSSSPIQENSPDENLLHLDVFFNHMNAFTNALGNYQPSQADSIHWQQAQAHSSAIHQIAVGIAEQEPAFIPDLLDALHSVLDLVSQLAQALHTCHQVQTAHYQTLAQQQRDSSLARLGQTRSRLQELYDQMLVGSLKRRSHSSSDPSFEQTATGITDQLQMLITDNQNGLLADQ
ncbi:MAG: hypothetical protein HC800_17215 [Phormidesmis sp. RL_2_1]|nr:hypothetical protein [Phormidesmis sp. RL_2_1]